MKTISFELGQWEAEFIPEDGGRISVLKFANIDLLTTKPSNFEPPSIGQGEYEARPVYGYDDCFPSVNACEIPEPGWQIRDHGQLCWQPWSISLNKTEVSCHTYCHLTGGDFSRKLIFNKNSLTWRYVINNTGKANLKFLHIVHPLMPVSEISDVETAAFLGIEGVNIQEHSLINRNGEIGSFLSGIPKNQYRMFFLKGLKEGKIRIVFGKGLKLTILYDQKLFPNLGIWWNNYGYPAPDAHFREECAFEPIPGINSNLADNIKQSTCFSIPPEGSFAWEIIWRVEH